MGVGKGSQICIGGLVRTSGALRLLVLVLVGMVLMWCWVRGVPRLVDLGLCLHFYLLLPLPLLLHFHIICMSIWLCIRISFLNNLLSHRTSICPSTLFLFPSLSLPMIHRLSIRDILLLEMFSTKLSLIEVSKLTRHIRRH